MKYHKQELDNKTTKYYCDSEGQKISFGDWIAYLLNSDEALWLLNEQLKQATFEAYFWEVKPVTSNTLDQPFEFVLVNSNTLSKLTENNSAFKTKFKPEFSVVSFPNLRGDAELVVPSPLPNNTQYVHLAKFVRTASNNQILAFWRRVVEVYKSKIGDQPKWLSTSGLGVHWLHVRIDSRPKYYQHFDYRLPLS